MSTDQITTAEARVAEMREDWAEQDRRIRAEVNRITAQTGRAVTVADLRASLIDLLVLLRSEILDEDEQ